MSDAWWIAGAATIGTTLGAAWGQLKAAWGYFASLLIVTMYFEEGYMQDAVRIYTKRRLSRTPFGPRAYYGMNLFVQPLRRRMLVALEITGHHGAIYWHGRRPVLVGKSKNADASDVDSNKMMPLSFLRGTFDRNELLADIVNIYNQVRLGVDDEDERRHSIRFVFGTAKKPAGPGVGSTANSKPRGMSEGLSPLDMLDKQIVGWQQHEIGQRGRVAGSSLDQLSLNDDAMDLVRDVHRWKEEETWFCARGIPWKRAARLVGEPGTGKTALVRAIAEDLDLPVFVFDLASLYNDELRIEWGRMLAETPAIALFEDVDNVFHGRQNVSGGELTFDALLNCLDGVERADGLFVVITTNEEAHLDPALTRPGRCGRRVEMVRLDYRGRMKMASRILRDWPELARELAEQECNDTGAEFEDRCVQAAVARFWDLAGQEKVMETDHVKSA